MGEQAANTNDWQNNLELIKDKVEHLFNTSVLHDCVFIVGTKPNQHMIKGHKLILAISSPVFEAMFYGDLAEQEQVLIPDMEPEIFRKILEYIYKNTIELQSLDEALEVYYGAKKYLIVHLADRCVKYMMSNLAPSSVCKIYEFAKFVEEQKLKEQCEKFLIEKTDAVLREVEFEGISIYTVTDILKLENLNITSELELFTALEKWIQQNEEESKRNSLAVRDALKHIRFLTMDSSEFAKGPANSVLLTEEEKIAVFKYMCTRDPNNHSMPDGLSQNLNPRNRLQNNGSDHAISEDICTGDSSSNSMPNGLSHNLNPRNSLQNNVDCHSGSILYGELESGRREQEGQLKRYKDVLHLDLKALNIKNNWEETAQDGTACRSTVFLFNDNQPDRPCRNLPAENYQCEVCGRNISSRIGLWSHMRVHKRGETAQDSSACRSTVSLFNDNQPDRSRRNVSGENYQCQVCGRNISSRIGLWSHMRTHR